MFGFGGELLLFCICAPSPEMQNKYKILIHIAFWIYIFNQILLTVLLISSNKAYDPFEEITIYPITSVITFYSVYFTYGLFFKKRNKLLPVLVLILVLAILIPFRIAIEYLFWKYIGYDHLKHPGDLLITRTWWFNSLRLVIIYSIYALLIKLAIGWYEAQKARSALVLERQASELAMLRYQVNPHFLFNTLNNIYSLVYKKSEDAPSAVMKMSAVMRYVLSDAKNDSILLEKELDYLKSYIELEKLRIKQQGFVEINISGTIEGKMIAPMLFIPFIENAFKHGSRNVPSPGIIINLYAGTEKITFEVTNYMRKNITGDQDKMGGIGLENIRRRLNLQYPAKHDLLIKRENEIHYIQLTIWY